MTIHHARHKATGTHVAIKVCSVGTVIDAEQLEIRNEAAILHRLQHVNILNMIEYFEEDDKAFLVTLFH